jgi:hypothetical protein
MLKIFKYPFLLFISIGYISAQTLDTSAIKTQLEFIYERDQKTRAKGDSTQFMPFIDSCNLAQVEAIIARHGWLGKSVIGPRGNYTLWLVIQHAELPIQVKYFSMLKKSVELGESTPSHLALLEDRILMRRGQKQIYGSQVIYNDKGQPEFYPIIDEKNVNVRRAEVGLEPIEEYAEHFGIDYKAP